MTRHNPVPSPEYLEFVETIQAFAHEHGETEATRALADGLEDALQKRFRDYWGVDERANTACFRRLITGDEECTCDRSWEERELERIGDRDDPPHTPPHSNQPTLWLAAGDPVVYSMHLYTPEVQAVSKAAAPAGRQIRNGWFDLFEFATAWGLELAMTPVSWYNPFSTVNVVFYSPEWRRREWDFDESPSSD